MLFDESMFMERISNYPLRRSVSSCIHYRLSDLQLESLQQRLKHAQASNDSLNGIVQCRGVSSDRLDSIVGWFKYEVSVSAQLTCNFEESLTKNELDLDQRLEFKCHLTQGWPASEVDCRIEVESRSPENSTLSIELVSWQRYYGGRLVCVTRRACPARSVCLGDLTADEAAVGAKLLYRVRAASKCSFTEMPDLGRTAARCSSNRGWPSARHRCKLVSADGSAELVADAVVHNASSIVSTFSAPIVASAKTAAANSTIECVVDQQGFPEITFNHVFAYEEKATLSAASLDWAPIIVSLIILLVILLVILVMVVIAVRRRRNSTTGGGSGRADNGGGKTG
uniref:Sushi domain-containing protein n=1 Tax=Macrostomum lignano TaxID=282301 RepID=A0A1I8I6C2_9PLAT